MPLPDTPDPKKSNLYRQLSSEQLGTASKTNFDIAQDSIFLDSSSEDELRRVNLIGQASNLQSQSGPIPGTVALKASADITGSGLYKTIFQPNEGEIWQLVDTNAQITNATGTVKLRLVLWDSASSAIVIIDKEDSSVTDEFVMQSPSPIFFDSNVYLRGWAQGTFDAVSYSAVVVRVR